MLITTEERNQEAIYFVLLGWPFKNFHFYCTVVDLGVTQGTPQFFHFHAVFREKKVKQ